MSTFADLQLKKLHASLHAKLDKALSAITTLAQNVADITAQLEVVKQFAAQAVDNKMRDDLREKCFEELQCP